MDTNSGKQTVGSREADRVPRSSGNAMALWNELGERQVEESSSETRFTDYPLILGGWNA